MSTKKKKFDKNGKFTGKFECRFKDGTGKWCRKTIKGSTAADNFLIEMDHAHLTGTGVHEARARQPLSVFAEEWFAAQAPTQHTRGNKRSHLDNHLLPMLGHKPISKITPLDMQKWITSLEEKFLSPNSIRHISGTARSLFAAARREKIIYGNPCDDWRRPKVPQKRMVPATVEQIQVCINEMPHRLRAAVVFVAGTGMRPAETFGVKVDDLEYEPGASKLYTRRQVHSYTGRPQQVKEQTKTGRERGLPIADELADLIIDHVNQYPSAERFVFTNTLGKPMHAHVFNRAWLRARRKVAARMRAEAEEKFAFNGFKRGQLVAQADYIEKMRFYDLRHFYASTIMRKTKNVKVVQELLGHTTAQMGLNNYVHLVDDDLDAARAATDFGFKID